MTPTRRGRFPDGHSPRSPGPFPLQSHRRGKFQSVLSVGNPNRTVTDRRKLRGPTEAMRHGAPRGASGALKAIRLAGRERTARLPWKRGLGDLASKGRKVKAGWGKGDLPGSRGGRAGPRLEASLQTSHASPRLLLASLPSHQKQLSL